MGGILLVIALVIGNRAYTHSPLEGLADVGIAPANRLRLLGRYRIRTNSCSFTRRSADGTIIRSHMSNGKSSLSSRERAG